MAHWSGVASAWTALFALQLAGCSGEEGGAGATDGSVGAGGSLTGPGASVASSTTGAGPGPGAGGSTGSGTVVCDPPAPPGSIYELSAVSYDIDQIDPVSMCAYRGEVMLIVNTAAA